jgi:two-component system alkaline phosphatase synthesis response regulator PhoP
VDSGIEILSIEDEPDIRELLKVTLEADGFRVISAATGEQGLQMARTEKPSLILLDLMLPKVSGLDICREIRADPEIAAIPILMLTAKATETDKVVGLEVGADDYVIKPFSPRELTARVKALLRRSRATGVPEQKTDRYDKGGLWIDFDTYEVRVRGQRVELSLREFELIRFFVTHPNRVYNRGQLLDLVWGSETHVEPRTVDVHIRRLRKHVEADDSSPSRIVTVRGVGYMFDDREIAETG